MQEWAFEMVKEGEKEREGGAHMRFCSSSLALRAKMEKPPVVSLFSASSHQRVNSMRSITPSPFVSIAALASATCATAKDRKKVRGRKGRGGVRKHTEE